MVRTRPRHRTILENIIIWHFIKHSLQLHSAFVERRDQALVRKQGKGWCSWWISVFLLSIILGNFALRRSEIVTLRISGSTSLILLMAGAWPSTICGSMNIPFVCACGIKSLPLPLSLRSLSNYSF